MPDEAPAQEPGPNLPAPTSPGPSTGKRILSALLGGFFDLTGAALGRRGYWARSLAFDPADLETSLQGKTALITGANSGIGKATAIGLARRGAEVWLLCRNATKGRMVADEIRRITKNAAVSAEIVDMSRLSSIKDFANRFPVEQVDILIHNAGSWTNEKKITDDGLEYTFATHVVGPFLLTQLLVPKLGASGEAGARVIFVSAHEMYSVKLSLDDMDWQKRTYDGARAFAMAKRCQVVLAEMLDDKLAGLYIHSASMHPGWVDTPYLRDNHRKFYDWNRANLRTPEEGADTVVWLAASPRAALPQGQFFFDRILRSPHKSGSTLEDPLERKHLFETCFKLSGSNDPTPPKPKAEYMQGKPRGEGKAGKQ